jgi:hypothetical protein
VDGHFAVFARSRCAFAIALYCSASLSAALAMASQCCGIALA